MVKIEDRATSGSQSAEIEAVERKKDKFQNSTKFNGTKIFMKNTIFSLVNIDEKNKKDFLYIIKRYQYILQVVVATLLSLLMASSSYSRVLWILFFIIIIYINKGLNNKEKI